MTLETGPENPMIWKWGCGSKADLEVELRQ